MKITAIIPARGGSKGLHKKNIALLGGFPLIAYSIVAAKLSSGVDRTIVSTDSEEIREIALRFGAEVPFLRPSEFAQDDSPDSCVFRHAADWFKKNEGEVPDWMTQLRPTTPLREPGEIDRAIDRLKGCPKAEGLRSAHELVEPPHKMFQMTSEGYFEGFFPDDPRPDYWNLPRQMLPKAYSPNGYIDIIKTNQFLATGRLYGAKILGYITPRTVEVDTPEDLERLSDEVSRKGHFLLDYLKKQFGGPSR